MTTETETPTEGEPAQDGSTGSSESASSTADVDAGASEAPEGSAPDAADAPEVPEAYRSEDGSADIAKLIERVSAADAAVDGLPEAPDGYDLALPDDIKGPDGAAFTIDPENEQLKSVLSALHAAKVPQSVVSEILPAYARDVAQMQNSNLEAHAEARNAEIAKLGGEAKANERMGGLRAAFTEILGNEKTALAALDGIGSAASFEAIEKLVSKLNGGDETRRVPGASGGADRPLHERMYGNQ